VDDFPARTFATPADASEWAGVLTRAGESLREAAASAMLRQAGLPQLVGIFADFGSTFVQVSNTAPSFEAHHGARRFGAGCGLLMRRAGRILKGFVVVDPDASVVPVSP